jgi:hypothetical protein
MKNVSSHCKKRQENEKNTGCSLKGRLVFDLKILWAKPGDLNS